MASNNKPSLVYAKGKQKNLNSIQFQILNIVFKMPFSHFRFRKYCSLVDIKLSVELL